MQSHFYTNGRPIFSLINASYIPMMMYLDKDGNVSNISYQLSNSQILGIISKIKGTVSK